MQGKRNGLALQWAMSALSGASLLLLLLAKEVHAATYVVDDTADAVDANPGDGVCASASPSAGCTLRAAIQEVNAAPSASGDSIELPAGTFALSLTGSDEDAAASGDLDISTSLVLTGVSAEDTVIDGGEIDRVLDVGPGILCR